MHPKHKLALLIGMSLLDIVFIVYTYVHHKYIGLGISIGVLVYYIPHFIFTIRDLKRLHGIQ